MANTIRIKKRNASGDAGSPTSLAPSEIAFNENASDLKLYYGFGDNGSGEADSIIAIGGSGAFWNKTDTRAATTVLAGPTTGSDAAPTFRVLAATDIPTLTAAKISDFDSQVQTNRLDELAAATSTISGVTPTADAHLCTKGYVDGVAQGLDVKDSVRAATTANGTLASAFANGEAIDGVTLATDDRILIKNQSTKTENGIYIVQASGAPARADDYASGGSAAGTFCFIEEGSTLADTAWVCTSNKGSDVINTNNLDYTQFSGSGDLVAGDGLDKTGTTISVDIKSGSGLQITSTELDTNADLTSLSACQSGAAAALALLTSTEVAILDGLTSTTDELNLLDGVTATTDELNYVDGVTSAIQTQLNAKISTSDTIDGGTY